MSSGETNDETIWIVFLFGYKVIIIKQWNILQYFHILDFDTFWTSNQNIFKKRNCDDMTTTAGISIWLLRYFLKGKSMVQPYNLLRPPFISHSCTLVQFNTSMHNIKSEICFTKLKCFQMKERKTFMVDSKIW